MNKHCFQLKYLVLLIKKIASRSPEFQVLEKVNLSLYGPFQKFLEHLEALLYTLYSIPPLPPA